MAEVKVLVFPNGEGLELPSYATAGSAGFDLRAAIEEDIVLPEGVGGIYIIPTGIGLEIPMNLEGQVRPRSGLAAKNGISIINSPGTIDPDYRGEIKVILTKLVSQEFTIKRGDRIAQLVLSPITRVILKESQALSATERGAGGFGSTGVNA